MKDKKYLIKQDMIDVMKNYIVSSDYNITLDDLTKTGLIFKKNKLSNSIKIISWFDAIIVSCSEDLYDDCFNMLKDKNREEIFEVPFVYGQSIYYIPDINKINDVREIDGFDYKLYSDDIKNIKLPEKFENVGEYDSNGNCVSKMLYCAYKDDQLIGVASAEEIETNIWELGIDVDEQYRKNGIGTYLSKMLTKCVLSEGIVPVWCAASTNISSQITAYKSGYVPLYVCSFGTLNDEYYPYKD